MANNYELRDLIGKNVFTKNDLARIFDEIVSFSDKPTKHKVCELKREFNLDPDSNDKYRFFYNNPDNI